MKHLKHLKKALHTDILPSFSTHFLTSTFTWVVVPLAQSSEFLLVEFIDAVVPLAQSCGFYWLEFSYAVVPLAQSSKFYWVELFIHTVVPLAQSSEFCCIAKSLQRYSKKFLNTSFQTTFVTLESWSSGKITLMFLEWVQCESATYSCPWEKTGELKLRPTCLSV